MILQNKRFSIKMVILNGSLRHNENTDQFGEFSCHFVNDSNLLVDGK